MTQSILDTIRTKKINARRGLSSGVVASDGIDLRYRNFQINARNTPLYKMMDALNQSGGYDRPAHFAVRLNPPTGIERVTRPSRPSLIEQLNPITGGSPVAVATGAIQDGINSALKGLFDIGQDRLQVIEMNANNVALPANALSMTEQKVAGLYRELPVQRSYEKEVTITFNLSRDMTEKLFFEQWLHAAVDRHTHKVKYRKQYATQIEILAYTADSQYYQNGNEDVSYTQILEEAYPKYIGQVERGYDQADTYSTIAITFAYKRQIEGRLKNLET